MPGALVEAEVKQVVSDGLVLSFLTFFTGTVDQFHLAQVTARFQDPRQHSFSLSVQGEPGCCTPTVY